MGTDFLRAKRQGRTKAWNRQLRTKANDLLVNVPSVEKHVCRAAMDDKVPAVGTQVMLQVEGDGLVVREETRRIGKVTNPPPELVQGIRQLGLVVASVLAQLDGARQVDLVLEN